MVVMKKINKKLFIKETGIYGRGVFANANIKKGEVIYKMDGKKLTLKEVVNNILSGKESEEDPLQVGRRTYIDLNEVSRTFNHSCNPNMGMRKRSELFALRDINKEEELTYDYSLTIAPTEWQMQCKCGSSVCRKELKDVTSISWKRLDEYREMGSIQTYMRKLLNEIKAGNYKMPRYEVIALEKLHSKPMNKI